MDDGKSYRRRSFSRAFSTQSNILFHAAPTSIPSNLTPNLDFSSSSVTIDSVIEDRLEDDSDNGEDCRSEGEHCLFCNESLGHMSESDSTEHLRNCIAKLRRGTAAATATESSSCIVCGIDLTRRGVWARCRHLKSCAKKFCISTKDLLQMLRGPDDEHEDNEELHGDLLHDLKEEQESKQEPEEEEQQEQEEEQEEEEEEQEESHNAVSEKPVDWPCSKCTYINAANLKKCEICLALNSAPSAQNITGPNAFTLMMASTKKLAPAGYSIAKEGDSTATTSASNDQNKKSFGTRSRWNRRGGNSTGGVSTFSPESSGMPPAYKMVGIPEMACPIIVDGFQYASKSVSDTYFLTHFHSDHYTGLTKHFDCGRIYCSPSTASLVRLRIKPSVNCVIPLKLETEYNISVGGVNVGLILVDANHCPGAVCIIFTFDNGKRVLHTGDFRWDNSLLERFHTYNNIAKNPSNLRNLTVYLDTTYCDPSHTFAKQEAVITEILENAISHLAGATSFVGGTSDSASEDSVKFSVLFLVGAYAIGKERVYMSLSQKLGLKVHVEKSRLQALLCLDWPIEDHARLISSTVTPEIVKGLPAGSIPAKAAILVVNMNQLNFDSIRHIEKTKTKHKFNKIVAYQPTGWTHTSGAKTQVKALHSAPTTLLKARCKDNITIYSAPYSEHSSFNELVDFLHTMKPQRVVPTVNTSADAVKKQLDILKRYSTHVYFPQESSMDGISTISTTNLHAAHKRKISSEFF